MSAIIYLGLGSNLGDRAAYLQSAIQELPPKIIVITKSPIYQTQPWGYSEQEDFLNQVIQGETELQPYELLAYIKALEIWLGRTPTFQNGPRQIDIDILFYDDQILQSPDLNIPHSHLHERAFCLVPLADIAPDLVHPSLNQSVKEILTNLDRSGVEFYKV